MTCVAPCRGFDIKLEMASGKAHLLVADDSPPSKDGCFKGLYNCLYKLSSDGQSEGQTPFHSMKDSFFFSVVALTDNTVARVKVEGLNLLVIKEVLSAD